MWSFRVTNGNGNGGGGGDAKAAGAEREKEGAEGETRIQPDRFGWCTAPKGNGSVSLC